MKQVFKQWNIEKKSELCNIRVVFGSSKLRLWVTF